MDEFLHPTGYKVFGNKILIDENRAAIVKQIFIMRRNGHRTLRQIAAELNRKGYPTVRGGEWKSWYSFEYMLKNRRYRGFMQYSGESVEREELKVV